MEEENSKNSVADELNNFRNTARSFATPALCKLLGEIIQYALENIEKDQRADLEADCSVLLREVMDHFADVVQGECIQTPDGSWMVGLCAEGYKLPPADYTLSGKETKRFLQGCVVFTWEDLLKKRPLVRDVLEKMGTADLLQRDDKFGFFIPGSRKIIVAPI